MATIKELFEKGVDKVRRKPWNPYARLELTRLESGYMGPWVHLVDLSGLPDEIVDRIPLLIIHADPGEDDGWEAWVEKPWPWEEK